MLSVKVDRNADAPLYAQLREAILAALRSSVLKPGDRLPAVVELARQLAVTPSTVRRAYEDLIKAGRIESYVGRGTFVAGPRAKRPALASSPAAADSPDQALAARRLRMGAARSLDAVLALAAKPGLLRFTAGAPSAETLQPGILADLTREALSQGQAAYAGYAPSAGVGELREAVARRFADRGAEVSPEQVLITSGSQQAISLLAQSAREERRRIILETPCYVGVARAFGAAGHWVESVIRDADGPAVEQLPAGDGRPPLLYLCPELHNPMGTDLGPQRREAIVDWARRTRALLIADEIFHDLRFDNMNPRSLLADAGPEQTAVIGSLSKSFMCGLRIGWLVSSPERVDSLAALKGAMDIGCAPLMQGIALALLRSGRYDDHVRRIRKLYHIRRDAILKALRNHMPDGVTWTRPAGGFHMWVELPRGYSSLALFLLAVERGVAIMPGPRHDVDHRFLNAFRLSYGSLRSEDINRGVGILGEAARELLKHPPGEQDPGGADSFL